jgi:murein DD-endopeptidase MepM/ murein hydrolase activator NlpD
VNEQSSTDNFRSAFKKTNWKILFFLAILGIGLGFYLSKNMQSTPQMQAALSAVEKIELSEFPIIIPTMKYGFAVDTFQYIKDDTIRSGQFLGTILNNQKVDYLAIEQLEKNAKDVFEVRGLRVNKPYTIFSRDTSKTADYFIYEPSVYEYILFHLQGDLKVEKVVRPVTTEKKAAAGIIESSLWNALTENGMSFELAAKMEDALQWSIDFHHLQKGDKFKMVYDQKFIDGKEVGVGMVHAAFYQNYNREFYSIFHEDEKMSGYYDREGRPMNSGFLRSPVKYSRISSHYNLNRYHPILKRRRPHFGTDYAAPYGTPILAVGSGVVLEATRRGGNGNFVKIKHDETYKTQYLHMQKFAKGIHPGVNVKQGDVIGYVGSTGLATGPHVCFRFWQNGKQVNHLKLNFPPPEPLPKTDLPKFYQARDGYLDMLNQAPFPYETKDLLSTAKSADSTNF